jgi:hypothetical protein
LENHHAAGAQVPCQRAEQRCGLGHVQQDQPTAADIEHAHSLADPRFSQGLPGAEPASGTTPAALAGYLTRHTAALTSAPIIIEQGAEMGRPGPPAPPSGSDPIGRCASPQATVQGRLHAAEVRPVGPSHNVMHARWPTRPAG